MFHTKFKIKTLRKSDQSQCSLRVGEPDSKPSANVANVVKKLDADIIGSSSGFWGPFGWKKYTYCDHTASGKAVKSIERFIEKKVLPHYANTHTTVSNTSLQTTIFRNEARTIIKNSVGATGDDEVIFCGSGATSTVHKLLHSISYPKSRKLIVLIGPYEHHSNILPWREAATKVIQVPMNISTGEVDTHFIRQTLKELANKKDKKNQLIIGCFSAGSNITGAMTDDIEITKLLHEFGALAFWDYAAAAPHVKIEMNPNREQGSESGHLNGNDTRTFKDAIFFSGHKFLGGPQTPGVLVVKKHVLQNPIPHGMGGGTVLFTTKKGHQYFESHHDREEGGTPNIVGSIRLGLVFQLRNLVGTQNVMEMEVAYCRRALSEWSKVPEIHILGHPQNPRLPLISFMIKHLNSGYFLHHNFVVALLNDLFGIQCRGGCMCAGPYAQELLGIDDTLASSYENVLKSVKDFGTVLKPGFVRISLSFHAIIEEVDFIIEAVKLIALHGWRLMPFYRIDWETASFVHKGGLQQASLSSLKSLDQMLESFTFENSFQNMTNPGKQPNKRSSFEESLNQAHQLLTSLHLPPQPIEDMIFLNIIKINKLVRKLRWFLLPSESLFFQQRSHIPEPLKSSVPFKPIKFGNSMRKYQPHRLTENSIPLQVCQKWRNFPEPEEDEISQIMTYLDYEFYQKHFHESKETNDDRRESSDSGLSFGRRSSYYSSNNEISNWIEDDNVFTNLDSQ